MNGSVCVPGDKSISHRAAIIAALATGVSEISNFSTSKDCAATLSCLEQLGVVVERKGSVLRIHGRGAGGLRKSHLPLDCCNSGSTMRMLAGVLAGQNFVSTLTGDDSLNGRPMGRIIKPLTHMGAHIGSRDGCGPLLIEGRSPLTAIRYELPIASAQVKSCVLLAGLNAVGRTEVIDLSGIHTRDHTERMFEWFGIEIENGSQSSGAGSTIVDGPASFSGRDVQVPGDFSSGAYLIAAAAMMAGSALRIENLGLNPTRTQFLDLLMSSGAAIQVAELHDESNEPRGTVSIQTTGLANTHLEVSGSLVAPLIDELPLLAVVGSQFGGVTVRDARELRIKESDRISATVTNLRAMGAEVEEYEDGLAVIGPVKLRGTTIQSFGDHRIAMAFTVAALVAQGDSEILGSDCVDVSFPGFFDVIESIVER